MAKHQEAGAESQSQNRPSRGAYESYDSDDSKSGRRQSKGGFPDARVQDDGRKKPASPEGGRGGSQQGLEVGADGRAPHGEDLGDVRPDPAVETSTPKLTND